MHKLKRAKTEQETMEEGQARLHEYVYASQELISNAVQKAKEQGLPAVFFGADEETNTRYALAINQPAVDMLIEKGGMEQQYTLISVVSIVSGRMTPIIAELHTNKDRLYYAITAL